MSGWAGFGVVAGLAVVCLILWEALSLADALAIGRQSVERQVAAGLSAALVLFTLLRVLTHLTGLTAYAWIGLALAVATCAVAIARWLRYRRTTTAAPAHRPDSTVPAYRARKSHVAAPATPPRSAPKHLS